MSDKPLPPTDKRLRDARDEGNVARSDMFAGLVVAAFATEAALACISAGAEGWLTLQQGALAQLASPDRIGACLPLIAQAAALVAALAGCVAAAAVAASVAASWACGGLAFAPKSLKPSLKRLNAARHAKERFSRKNLTAASLAIVTAAIVGAVAVFQLHRGLPLIGAMIDWQSLGFDRYASIVLLRTFVRTLFVALIVPAALSAIIARVQHRRGLRMSHREIRDEVKQTSGDPAMRAYQRTSFSETMAVPPVRNASGRQALITNPEHVGVLLHYAGDTSEPPIVIGKALDADALQMTNDALTERVLVFRFRRLARHLFQHAALQAPIPPECYRAVAIVYRIVDEMQALDDRPKVPIDIDDAAFDEPQPR